MKMRFIIIKLFLLVTIFSCEERPAYEKEGWTISQYQPNEIELSKATLNGNPIILRRNELLEIEGNPIEVRDSCTKLPRHNLGMAIYDCWIYDSMWNKVYQIVNDTAFLSHLNFEENNLEIRTPQITLSGKTRFKEIKNKFPNSYAHRNAGANYYSIDEGYDWVYLIDDLPSEKKLYSSFIELIFKDGRLKNLEYHWEPTYTKEQLEIYHQQMKEDIEKN